MMKYLDSQICVSKHILHHYRLLADLLFTFTFMHLADTFIQSNLQCIPATHFLYYGRRAK